MNGTDLRLQPDGVFGGTLLPAQVFAQVTDGGEEWRSGGRIPELEQTNRFHLHRLSPSFNCQQTETRSQPLSHTLVQTHLDTCNTPTHTHTQAKDRVWQHSSGAQVNLLVDWSRPALISAGPAEDLQQ